MHERDHAREFGAVRSGLAATALLCVVELVGGYLTNSLALMSDAAHMFTDMAALGLTLFALWIGGGPAAGTKTLRYYPAGSLAAPLNGGGVWGGVGFFLAAGGGRRPRAPARGGA